MFVPIGTQRKKLFCLITGDDPGVPLNAICGITVPAALVLKVPVNRIVKFVAAPPGAAVVTTVDPTPVP